MKGKRLKKKEKDSNMYLEPFFFSTQFCLISHSWVKQDDS